MENPAPIRFDSTSPPEYLEAIVVETIEPGKRGRVSFQGIVWLAQCKQAVTLQKGSTVYVTERQGLTLIIETLSANVYENKEFSSQESIVVPDQQEFLDYGKISRVQHETLDTLPLIDLFVRLREAGLPLGINEYFLVLRALQKGFGTDDHKSLAELCQTLWVKSKDEEHLFNYHFEQVMQSVPLPTSPSSTETEQKTVPNLPKPNAKQEMLGGEPNAEELTASTTSTAISQELMEVEDEIQVAEAVQIATRSNGEVVVNRFTQSDEYFPVTRRQMKQSWRHLRRMVREGPPVEIDIEATIAHFSQQGIPSDPVMVPGRINRTELLLLLDHKGSMVPFHALSQRLAETAQRGGRLGDAGVFYFHNCPTQYLYRDPSRQQAELISDLLMKLRPERSVVLIFSDGGAARGGFNPERVELTNQFLARLKERVRYVTWLNPMSEDRWASTTAGEIAQRVPMFEMSRKGMEGAIDVLRGRSLQVIG